MHATDPPSGPAARRGFARRSWGAGVRMLRVQGEGLRATFLEVTLTERASTMSSRNITRIMRRQLVVQTSSVIVMTLAMLLVPGP